MNRLDSGAPYYDTYQTRDGKWIAIGAIEPQFYALLRERIGVGDDPDFDAQDDPAVWPRLKEKLTELFRTRTRDEWCAILEATDACFAAVLSLAEAPHHPHNAARGTFIEIDGVTQPAPAPRYSVTAAGPPMAPAEPGAHTDEILASMGCDAACIAALRRKGVVA